MSLIRPSVVAPDTSHWANWIDAALGSDPAKRYAARHFHDRLLDAGKVPFLSWHHLEELLCVDSAANARARVTYLQAVPTIAWMRLPDERDGIGAITDIIAAEAIASDAGCADVVAVRDHVRSMMMRTGPAVEAVGGEGWVWGVARPVMLQRWPHLGMVTALSGMRTMDERQTVGELARKSRRPPEEWRAAMAGIHAKAVREAVEADPRRSVEEARAMADDFMARVLELAPADAMPVRDMIVATYAGQGVNADEVRDECTIAELSRLGTFRFHLRVVAEKTNLPFERLKRVRMETLPSWRIGQALRRHGQKRVVRPGSDMHDEHLAVLAAYTDELYVDKRTHEDFRRVIQKEPELARLFGRVAKASRYDDLVAGPAAS